MTSAPRGDLAGRRGSSLPDPRLARWSQDAPWESDTLCLIWSATKGLASACVLHALDQEGIDLDTRVAFVWPEFARTGRKTSPSPRLFRIAPGFRPWKTERATPGLPGRDHGHREAGVGHSARMAHAYGPRTFGFVADEILRRVTGTPVSVYWRTHFADPLDLDAWIGLPEEYHSRVAQMLPPRAHSDGGTEEAFNKALADGNSLTRRALQHPGIHPFPDRDERPGDSLRATPLPRWDRERTGSGEVL